MIYLLTFPKQVPQRTLNPINAQASMPGISCFGTPSSCGRIWASPSPRIHKDLLSTNSILRENLPASPEEFALLQSKVQSYLGLYDVALLTPGTQIGSLRAKRMRKETVDFDYIGSTTTLISCNVLQSLTKSNLTGWHTEHIYEVDGRIEHISDDYVELTTIAEAVLPTELFFEVWTDCLQCGYKKYNIKSNINYNNIQVPYDFLRIKDIFPNLILVSERTKDFLERKKLQNYNLIPLENYLQSLNLKE